MGEQTGLAPLLPLDLAPVTVDLNLRESGARFPCKWSSVLEIYTQKEQEERQRLEKQRKREKAYREKRKAKKIAENGGEIIKTKTCPHCAKVFTPTSNRQLFCSRECWNQARQEQKKADREAERGDYYYRQRTCAVCGHSYWPTHSQQEFCSDECRRINHNKKTLEFYHKKKGNPKPDPEAVPTPKPKEDNAA